MQIFDQGCKGFYKGNTTQKFPGTIFPLTLVPEVRLCGGPLEGGSGDFFFSVLFLQVGTISWTK